MVFTAPDASPATGAQRRALRVAAFAVILAASLLAFSSDVAAMARLALHDARYTHIALVPPIALAFLYRDRQAIFARPVWSRLGGAAVLVFAVAGFLLAFRAAPPESPTFGFSLLALLLIALWASAFALCFGGGALRRGLFPWGFLLLAAPLPAPAVDAIVAALQRGSAEFSFLLFKAIGTPVVRDGFLFGLPGVTIEITTECSGIRSSLSLFVVSVLAGKVFLTSIWRRIGLCAATIPIVIFKNALRIVGISWLGLNVDRQFFDGPLHHQYGGLVFSVASLALQAGALAFFYRSEARSRARSQQG
jgi:exosortase